MSERITIEVWQDGLCVASVDALPEAARREAWHYALIYSQDGPVRILGKSKGKRWTIADLNGAAPQISIEQEPLQTPKESGGR